MVKQYNLKKSPGLTLTEIIIALSIIGVAAAVLIPKIAVSVEQQEYRSKAKEVANALQQAYTSQLLKGTSRSSTLYAYLYPALNVREKSTAKALFWGNAHPCYLAAYCSDGWIKLPNGAVVEGLVGCLQWDPTLDNPDNYNQWPLCIDLNGIDPPNKPGEDVFSARFNKSAVGHEFDWCAPMKWLVPGADPFDNTQWDVNDPIPGLKTIWTATDDEEDSEIAARSTSKTYCDALNNDATDRTSEEYKNCFQQGLVYCSPETVPTNGAENECDNQAVVADCYQVD
jgi:prepilin-type N-terminal cleavage/methylation domain-containing protein